MKVKEAMHKGVQWVGPDTPVAEVAKLMCENDIGAIPVGENDRLIGMVTDRDIVVRCIADGKNPNDAKVNDVMTKSIRKVQEDATINEVIGLMKGSEIRRVPVVDRNDKIVGIVSIGDIASGGENRGKVGDAIEDISEAAPNN